MDDVEADEGCQVPGTEEIIDLAKSTGVRFMACTTSMGMMGISREAFIPEADSYCGVATYLAEARESKINLFI